MIALILALLFGTPQSCFPLSSQLSGGAFVVHLRTGTTEGGATLWSARPIAAILNGADVTITPTHPLILAATQNDMRAFDPAPFTLSLCAPVRAPTILYFPMMQT